MKKEITRSTVKKKKQEKSGIAEHFDVTLLARKIPTRISPFGTDPVPVPVQNVQIRAYILILIICKLAIVIAIVKMEIRMKFRKKKNRN